MIDQKDADGIVGYYTSTYGYSLGMDRRIARRTIVGIGFGNSFADTTMNRGLGNAYTRSYLFSAYGGHREGSLQLSGGLGYVHSNLTSTRLAPSIDGWARVKRNADTWFSSFEVANQFGSDASYLTPFVSYDFVNYREKGFSETGHLMGMTIDRRKVDAYVQTLGARMGTRYVNRHGSIVNPVLTLGWIHDYGKGATSTVGRFNEAGTPFTLVGTSRNKNRGLVGLHVNTVVNRGLSVFARYDGEFANKYHSQNFQAGMTLEF